jgi:hypothetical protein
MRAMPAMSLANSLLQTASMREVSVAADVN